MPKKISPTAEHRIPVNDHALFEELRQFAMSKNMTWVEALRDLLDSADELENVKTGKTGDRRASPPADA